MHFLRFVPLTLIGFFVTDTSLAKQLLSADEARSDIRVMSEILTTAHPALDRYQSHTEWQLAPDEALNTTNESLSVIKLNYKVRQLLSAIQCGHTTSYIPREMRMARLYSDSIQVAPLVLAYVDGKPVVVRSLSTHLPENARIVSINDYSADSLMQAWSQFSFPGDAGISTRTPYFVADEFNLFVNDFIGPSEYYELTIEKDGESQSISVNAITTRSWREARKAWKNDTHQPWLDYQQLHDDKIAYLRIRMFGDYQLENGERGKYKKFISDSFKSMASVSPKALIIDLRENDGGEGRNGAMLYAMIAQEPYEYFDRWESKVNEIPHVAHADISKIERAAINSLLKKRMTPTENGYRVNSWHGTLSIQEPRDNAYQGPVYVLVDGRTFSAASDFVAVAKSNKRVTVIGEETGGAYAGNNSGVTINYKLPHSGIRIQVPLAAGYNKVVNREDKGGVMPDYVTAPSQALEIALELINSN
ncbi:MAG: S41 family peptidase [Cyclobacteriaceae bacterium]